MDPSKLTKEQREIAIKIADQARAAGVDPELALAVGWAENAFNPTGRSPKGALGPMQVMPANAKGLGIDPKDLLDPDKNIAAGVAILRENLDRFKDPVTALVGYNANPTLAAKFAEQRNDQLLPAETRAYLDKIRAIHNLAPTQTSPFGPIAPLPAESAPPETAKGLPEGYQMARQFLMGDAEIEPSKLQFLGAGAGALVGTGERLYDIFGKKAAQAGDQSGYAKWLRNWAGIERPDMRGIPKQSQTYQKIKTHGEAGEKVFKKYGTDPLDIKRYLENAALEKEIADRAARSQMAEKASKFLGRIPGGSIIAGGAAGLDIGEAMKQYEEGDTAGALINAVGGLGSAAALIPHPATRLVGGALSLASMPAEYINDLLKGRIKKELPPPSMEYMAP